MLCQKMKRKKVKSFIRYQNKEKTTINSKIFDKYEVWTGGKQIQRFSFLKKSNTLCLCGSFYYTNYTLIFIIYLQVGNKVGNEFEMWYNNMKFFRILYEGNKKYFLSFICCIKITICTETVLTRPFEINFSKKLFYKW